MNKLWRTSDGGRSWQPTDLPSGPNSFGYADRVSADTGFLLLAPIGQTPPAGTLYRTGDGGATWSQVATVPAFGGGLPSAKPGMTQPLVFADASNGLLVEGNEGQTVLQTHDGGVTWTPVELPKPSDPEAFLLSVTDLRVFGSHVVITAVIGLRGDGGTSTEPVPANYPVYTSDDAGRTWQVVYPHEVGAFPVSDDQQYGEWSIVDSLTWVYMHGQDVAMTRDAGATWSKVAGSGLPVGAISFRPAFVSPTEGWVLLGFPRVGTFATTHDGGATWQVTGPYATPPPTS
jgi:photosystem II stability/assembly factor-like uncharacterized protein